MFRNIFEIRCKEILEIQVCQITYLNTMFGSMHLQSTRWHGLDSTTIVVIVRDATQSPGKSPIFSPLKIGGWRGVNPDFGRFETKYSNCRDRISVHLGKLRLKIDGGGRGIWLSLGTLCCIPKRKGSPDLYTVADLLLSTGYCYFFKSDS